MRKSDLLSSILLAAFAVSCSGEANQDGYPARIDKEFTRLYCPDSDGVVSADGTISILLEDGSSLFMTGDCFIGDVVNGQRNPDDVMINNTLVHISPDYKYLGAHYGGTKENPQALFVPAEADTAKCHYWYWPGHGFQRGRTLYVYMSKFYQAEPGQWGFRYDGVDFIKMNLDDYSVISVEESYDGSNFAHWGHCVMLDDTNHNGTADSDEYYYIYGSKAVDMFSSQLCVSRSKFDESSDGFSGFEYFDGKSWMKDCNAAAACEGIDVSVSEQFSVFQYKDKYVLLTQSRGASEIYTFIADTPVGPWYNKTLLYVTDEQDKDKNLFTYNAMAHPQFVNGKEELLFNYNVNSYDASQIARDVNTYRPVFLRVPMKVILK